MKKKPKKGAKNTKPVTKTEQCESFFNFFNPPQVPDDDDIDQDTVSSERLLCRLISFAPDECSPFLFADAILTALQAEQLQELMEQDYDVGYVYICLSRKFSSQSRILSFTLGHFSSK